MSNPSQNFAAGLRSLQTLFGALLLGQIGLLLVFNNSQASE